MNTLVLICALVAGASATNLYQGLLGYSGIVKSDGNNVQFTREQADNIVLVGPSGAVTRDGKNMQLLPEAHRSKRSTFYQGLMGHSGIVKPDGNVQFTREEADNIILVGPSGVVTRDGRNMQRIPDDHRVKRSTFYQGLMGHSGIVKPDGNVQFTREEADNIILVGPSGVVTRDGRNMQRIPDDHRVKRSTFYQGLMGHSGIVKPDGNVQFTREEADNIILVGPSGVVTRDGRNMQRIPDDHRVKRSTFYQGLMGHSGIVKSDGNNVQFTREQADNIVLVGPSGVVTRDGRNMQRIPDDHRVKRGAGYVNSKGSIGYSGIVKTDGTIRQFSQEDIDNIVLFGPSGVVTKDGRNWQLDEDLNIHRSKRHLIGASGMITKDGTPVQFKEGGAEILLEGASGIIMSDGTLVQLRSQ
ncbi:uncharacterized protein [Palaemon carinicauda]|uniref:uncharacterized protein n=1 Tax=Palaemon carinicauda TaxID=392227 RepID=UPI0035B64E2E